MISAHRRSVATEGALGFSSQIGERALSGAGSASEQAQLLQTPNGFANTSSSVVRCSLRDFSLSDRLKHEGVSSPARSAAVTILLGVPLVVLLIILII